MASYGSSYPSPNVDFSYSTAPSLDTRQIMADMAEFYPKLTPEYQAQAREAHEHVLQLQRQGMTNEALSLLEHMRNQMREMVRTGLTPGHIPVSREVDDSSQADDLNVRPKVQDSERHSWKTELPRGATRRPGGAEIGSQPELVDQLFSTPVVNVPATAPVIQRHRKDAESIRRLRRQVRELKVELARTKGPESAEEMERKLKMQEMEEKYSTLENTVRDLRSVLSAQLSKTSQVVQQAENQTKEQKEKTERPKNPFCRHGDDDDLCEFCETRKARTMRGERSPAVDRSVAQERYDNLFLEMQNTLLSYQRSLMETLKSRKEELKKNEDMNKNEPTSNPKEVDNKGDDDDDDEFSATKFEYEKRWGKETDLSPRTLALAIANESRTAAEAAIKHQEEAEKKAKEQEEKVKSFQRQARKAAGSTKKGGTTKDSKNTSKSDKKKATSTATTVAKGKDGESDEEDSDDSDIVAKVLDGGNGADVAASVQLAELRKHQQAEIEKQRNTLNEQRRAIEEQTARLKQLQEELKARANQQELRPHAEALSSDNEQEDDDDENSSPSNSPAVYQPSGGVWVPGRPADREEYINQQQPSKGAVPLVNAVLVPPEKIVGEQQQEVASPSYAAVASGVPPQYAASQGTSTDAATQDRASANGRAWRASAVTARR
ncbi:merozoite surface protein 3g, putative [Perkinsus marinus ATCC 50983]|uniref:Merozoite surface protein 3g, putative n=1 Tax=Perkinsus marinus (strain ATCC 50983 / TXsc) TaxID=423536 RepID=C5LLE1_PERM5|nr:merozoite surface protein 3g, putative [Perkinsus marinus ATCC 50983]EER02440.1 merozoite surface protein 3g, putative [Perkinsus marinus ATCC 50983]|eukprot:XP_002769722.1 merozoite surface protein 3g, putative [Perkinsus marinus ATCC 50983]